MCIYFCIKTHAVCLSFTHTTFIRMNRANLKLYVQLMMMMILYDFEFICMWFSFTSLSSSSFQFWLFILYHVYVISHVSHIWEPLSTFFIHLYTYRSCHFSINMTWMFSLCVHFEQWGKAIKDRNDKSRQ